MKRVLFATLIACTLLCVSCNSHKRVWYLQDASDFATEQIATQGQIRIQPLDRLTIIVNSKDPELAVPFNAATGYTALTPLASASISSSSALQVRTVDEKGYLQMPIIGELKVVGLTRGELSKLIADKIIAGGYINDPTVNVQFVDMKFSVLGEVTHGGNFAITHDKLTIFDALAMAGDMTIFGQRSDVMVYREVDGVRQIEYLDLTSKDVFSSPAFYIRQNDVIYVKPNKYKAQTGEINQNRSFYISLVSTAIAVATLIVTITK